MQNMKSGFLLFIVVCYDPKYSALLSYCQPTLKLIHIPPERHVTDDGLDSVF
jgi:hypothetical protein